MNGQIRGEGSKDHERGERQSRPPGRRGATRHSPCAAGLRSPAETGAGRGEHFGQMNRRVHGAPRIKKKIVKG